MIFPIKTPHFRWFPLFIERANALVPTPLRGEGTPCVRRIGYGHSVTILSAVYPVSPFLICISIFSLQNPHDSLLTIKHGYYPHFIPTFSIYYMTKRHSWARWNTQGEDARQFTNRQVIERCRFRVWIRVKWHPKWQFTWEIYMINQWTFGNLVYSNMTEPWVEWGIPFWDRAEASLPYFDFFPHDLFFFPRHFFGCARKHRPMHWGFSFWDGPPHPITPIAVEFSVLLLTSQFTITTSHEKWLETINKCIKQHPSWIIPLSMVNNPGY